MKRMGMTFTYAVSLEEWVQLGLFDREKRIYEEHLRQKNFDEIIWFTYGMRDSEIAEKLVLEGRLDERIKVVGRPKWAKGKVLKLLYSVLLPSIHKDVCKELSVVKSNQMQGARVAAAIAKRNKIPFVFRTGYTFSNLAKNKIKNETDLYKKAKLWLGYKKSQREEKRLYTKCDIATVSSLHDKEYVCNQYHVDDSKVKVVTNYIDCDLFFPEEDVEKSDRFIFVGRLNKEKNLFHIIDAISELHLGLDIYGKGELKEELAQHIKKKKADVCLKGTLDNGKLPEEYNRHRYFILASPFEGMPKSLLEAMACGCVCFGTDTTGIKEVITDRENGYLIRGASNENIVEAIRGSDATKDEAISKKAVQYIREKHSLQTVCKEEWEMMKQKGKTYR